MAINSNKTLVKLIPSALPLPAILNTCGSLTKLDPTTIPRPRVLETADLTHTMSEKLSFTTSDSKHAGVISPR